MVEPIELRPKKRANNLVWVCTTCQCTTYYLHEDSVECACCGLLGPMEGEWRRFVGLVPYAEDAPAATLDGTMGVVDFTTGQAALQHTLKGISYELVEAIIVIQKNGEVNTWGGAGVETAKQIKWAKGRFKKGMQVLFGKKP